MQHDIQGADLADDLCRSLKTSNKLREFVVQCVRWHLPLGFLVHHLRLRAAAQEELGARFDVRAFHDQVLGRGMVTLPLLRTLVEEWMAGVGATGETAGTD